MALFSKPHSYDLQAEEIVALLQSLAGNEPMPPVKVPVSENTTSPFGSSR